MASLELQALHDRALTLTVVTNSIRTIAPHTTFRDDPTAYMNAEIDALKAPLLYGDKVRLKSYLLDVATMAKSYETLARMPLHAVRVPISFVADASNETLRAYGLDPSSLPIAESRELLRTIGNMETEDRISTMFDFKDRHFEALWPAARAIFDSAEKFSADVVEQMFRLEQAVEAGLVDVEGWSDERPGLFEHEELYVLRAGEALMDAVVNATSPLVVDVGASITLRMTGQGTHAIRVAEDLLRPLPAFSRATLDEILDIRKELAGPLGRFRVEVADIADSIDHEEDYVRQLNGIWQRKVRPALDELDELTQENSYLRQLAGKITEAKTMLPAGATFALGIGGLTGLAQVAAASAAVAAVPLEALRAKVKERRALTRKRLYFLWKLSKR